MATFGGLEAPLDHRRDDRKVFNPSSAWICMSRTSSKIVHIRAFSGVEVPTTPPHFLFFVFFFEEFYKIGFRV